MNRQSEVKPLPKKNPIKQIKKPKQTKPKPTQLHFLFRYCIHLIWGI